MREATAEIRNELQVIALSLKLIERQLQIIETNENFSRSVGYSLNSNGGDPVEDTQSITSDK